MTEREREREREREGGERGGTETDAVCAVNLYKQARKSYNETDVNLLSELHCFLRSLSPA